MDVKNNYVFFGSPDFAAEILEKLTAGGSPPKMVVANPDRPQGRNKKITPPPAKTAAEKSGLPVWQPEKLELEEFKSKTAGTEFGLVAAYSKILPKEILGLFPKGILGLHPSLLPKYRGASPMQSALLAGEKETGISLYLMDEKVDHGPILGESKVEIEDMDDYFSLEKKLARAGAKLFMERAPRYLSGELHPLPQDESSATYTKKFKTQDAFMPQEELLEAMEGRGAGKVRDKIRALVSEPGAWTLEDGKRVKLLAAKVENGKLKITRMQKEGKKSVNL